MDGCYFHDAIDIAYVMDPRHFWVELGAVRVSCEGIGHRPNYFLHHKEWIPRTAIGITCQ